MKVSASAMTRTSLCKTKQIQNQTMQTVQKAFCELCVGFSVPRCFPGLALECGTEMPKRATTIINSRTGSSTAPTVQGSASISAVVFFQEGSHASKQRPTALWGCADLLESALGLSVLSSIVQHRHPRSNILQTTEEASPSAGNSAPSTRAPDECLKSKVIPFPLILYTLSNIAGGSLCKQTHISGRTLPTSPFRLLGNTHLPVSSSPLTVEAII